VQADYRRNILTQLMIWDALPGGGHGGWLIELGSVKLLVSAAGVEQLSVRSGRASSRFSRTDS
jgi:hypothetical protein